MKKVLGTSPTPNNLRKQLSLGGARAKSHTENFFPLVTPPWHLPVPEGPGSHSWLGWVLGKDVQTLVVLPHPHATGQSARKPFRRPAVCPLESGSSDTDV